MDHAEELKQIDAWLADEGLAPDASKEAQLGLLWRTFQHTRSRLSCVTRDLETHRAQHLAEMAEVRKSLEQIRIFTEHKDVLAQEIQDENDQLKDQLRRIISLQDAQISEVAKMLYQQGLTELIHSSPSEQVAYLLVERASLLETSEGPSRPTGGANAGNLPGTEGFNSSLHQAGHKVVSRHGQSTWKRLFGLHRTPQSKHPFIPAEAGQAAGQAAGLERECSRLERDLEEGSRRLAMAHTEIRRLTDELESAHLTQRAYEPELESAQQEVEQLRHEVEKLKKYEMVELRKVKELNDRLDFEIRALRSRVRSLDAEKSSLQQMVASLQEEVKQLDSALQEQQLLAKQVPTNQTVKQAENKAEQLESPLHEQPNSPVQVQAEEKVDAQKAELAESNQMCRNLQEKVNIQTKHLLQKGFLVESLQKELERLKSVLQEQQQQIVTTQLQAERAGQLAESRTAELIQSNQTCKDLQNKLQSLQQQQQQQQLWDDSHDDLVELIAKIRTQEENNRQDQRTMKQQKADSQLWENSQQEDSHKTEDKRKQNPSYEENKLQKGLDNQEAMKTLLSTQEECESLKEEICETLKCLDKEQSKYHELKERHKTKMCRAKQKFADVTAWHNEKINKLERELSLCCHSLTKEKELVRSMNVENEKLLCERRKLLQQLDEEEHSKKDLHLSALLSKRRVEFLEAENKKLGNKILHLSNQLGVLHRSVHNTNSLHFAEEIKKLLAHQQRPVQTSSVASPDRPPVQASLDCARSSPTKRTDPLPRSPPTSHSSGSLPRSAEMGYLNVATQSQTDPSAGAIKDSESVLC